MSKFAALGLEVEKPARLFLVHPVTQEPLKDDADNAAYIDIYSGDSEIASKHQNAVRRRRLARGERTKMTPEELERDGLELLAALSAGWHLVGLDGKALDVPFSIASARELYSERSMTWLREQVDGFAADRANFSKASSTN